MMINYYYNYLLFIHQRNNEFEDDAMPSDRALFILYFTVVVTSVRVLLRN